MATAVGYIYYAVAIYLAYEANQTNKEVAKTNKQLVEQQRKDALLRRARDNRKQLGKQKSRYAFSGVSIDEGSPLAVLEEQLQITEEDLNAINSNADIRARQAQLQYEQAQNQQNSAVLSGALNASSTTATSGSSGGSSSGIADYNVVQES